jgi:hypothetical protein
MEGMNTTNAVQCSTCQTNNPRFFINCKKCGKKLDMMDRRVYDADIDKKPEVSNKVTPVSMLIFIIVFSTFLYFGFKILGIGRKKENPVVGTYGQLSKVEFISKVKENSSVIDADITDVNFLYITVTDDGTNKDAMAVFYCRLAKEYNVAEVSAVKVVDAATAILSKNGTAQGKELGKSFCN